MEEEIVIGIALHMDRLNAVVHERAQGINIFFILSRDEDAVAAEARHPGLLQVLERVVLARHGREVIFLLRHIRKIVDLVENDDGRFLLLAYLADGLLDDLVLLLEIGVADIHHVDEQIRLAHLVQGRFEAAAYE